MIRRVAVAVLALAASCGAASADFVYENARYGYSLAVPDEFYPAGPPPETGDGRTWFADVGTATLTVNAAAMLESTFSAEIDAIKALERDAGWRLTYETGGDGWAVWSGVRDGEILYARSESHCAADAVTTVRVIYAADTKRHYDPFLEGLAERLSTPSC